jgi:hypothetical protein
LVNEQDQAAWGEIGPVAGVAEPAEPELGAPELPVPDGVEDDALAPAELTAALCDVALGVLPWSPPPQAVSDKAT